MKTVSASTACPLCRSELQRDSFLARDYEHSVPGEWRVVECMECGLLFQQPMPPASQLPSFYPPSYSAYNSNSFISLLFRFVYWLDAHRIRALIGPHGRVLDVGCGSGAALQRMSELGQWELFGLELDAGAAFKARQRGLDVQQGDVVTSDFLNGTFDLIRLGHVLEHVVDPSATVKRIFSLLRPGGIFFGEVPNTECFDFRLFGRYWGALHIPRHLTFFNRTNLRGLLEGAGFEKVDITPRMRTVGWSCGLQNFFADRFGLEVPETGRVPWYGLLILPFLPVTFVQSLFGTTATVGFVARKPSGMDGD